MSNFKSLKIKKEFEYELNKLLVHVLNDSHVIFSLFFIEIVLQKFANNTNRYVVNHSHHNDDDKSYVRIWFDIIVRELRTYIAIYIYMSVHKKSRIECYWNTDENKESIHSLIRNRISLVRWQQINHFFIFQFISKRKTYFKKWIILTNILERFSNFIEFSKFIWLLMNQYNVSWVVQAKSSIFRQNSCSKISKYEF